jgi:hypothetical protein
MKAKIDSFLENDRNLKFHMYCYTLGKEEIACNLARDYLTKIIINEERWNRMGAIGIAEQYFIKESDWNLEREKQRSEGISDEEFKKKNVEIHIRPIRDRPHNIGDLNRDDNTIHFMLTAMSH